MMMRLPAMGHQTDVFYAAMNAYDRIHANAANKLLHCLGIPAITVAVFGMLLALPYGIVLLALLAVWCVGVVGYKSLVAGLHLFFYGAVLFAASYALGHLTFVAEAHYFFLKLFVIGWLIQFLGHFFEKKTPEFTSSPINLLIGPLAVLYFALPFLRSSRARD